MQNHCRRERSLVFHVHVERGAVLVANAEWLYSYYICNFVEETDETKESTSHRIITIAGTQQSSSLLLGQKVDGFFNISYLLVVAACLIRRCLLLFIYAHDK